MRDFNSAPFIIIIWANVAIACTATCATAPARARSPLRVITLRLIPNVHISPRLSLSSRNGNWSRWPGTVSKALRDFVNGVREDTQAAHAFYGFRPEIRTNRARCHGPVRARCEPGDENYASRCPVRRRQAV